MVHNSAGLHHFHKRIHQKPYPHRQKWKNFLDKSIYIVGLIGPIMTFPQIYNIWVLKNATGVSAVSWGAFLFAAIFWFIYGLSHKEKPIIVLYSLWIIMDISIVTGTLLYG